MVFQEWPEEVYPPYANGPGYIVSSDVAEYVASKFDEHKLRVSFWLSFKFLCMLVFGILVWF